MLAEVLDEIRFLRIGAGRHWTRPDAGLGGSVYSSGIIRWMLSRRCIRTLVPQLSNEARARKKRDSAGGRPPAFDADAYKGRNVVERHFALAK